MPTYVFDRIKRTIPGQKVVDSADVGGSIVRGVTRNPESKLLDVRSQDAAGVEGSVSLDLLAGRAVNDLGGSFVISVGKASNGGLAVLSRLATGKPRLETIDAMSAATLEETMDRALGHARWKDGGGTQVQGFLNTPELAVANVPEAKAGAFADTGIAVADLRLADFAWLLVEGGRRGPGGKRRGSAGWVRAAALAGLPVARVGDNALDGGVDSIYVAGPDGLGEGCFLGRTATNLLLATERGSDPVPLKIFGARGEVPGALAYLPEPRADGMYGVRRRGETVELGHIAATQPIARLRTPASDGKYLIQRGSGGALSLVEAPFRLGKTYRLHGASSGAAAAASEYDHSLTLLGPAIDMPDGTSFVWWTAAARAGQLPAGAVPYVSGGASLPLSPGQPVPARSERGMQLLAFGRGGGVRGQQYLDTADIAPHAFSSGKIYELDPASGDTTLSADGTGVSRLVWLRGALWTVGPGANESVRVERWSPGNRRSHSFSRTLRVSSVGWALESPGDVVAVGGQILLNSTRGGSGMITELGSIDPGKRTFMPAGNLARDLRQTGHFAIYPYIPSVRFANGRFLAAPPLSSDKFRPGDGWHLLQYSPQSPGAEGFTPAGRTNPPGNLRGYSYASYYRDNRVALRDVPADSNVIRTNYGTRLQRIDAMGDFGGTLYAAGSTYAGDRNSILYRLDGRTATAVGGLGFRATALRAIPRIKRRSGSVLTPAIEYFALNADSRSVGLDVDFRITAGFLDARTDELA